MPGLSAGLPEDLGSLCLVFHLGKSLCARARVCVENEGNVRLPVGASKCRGANQQGKQWVGGRVSQCSCVGERRSPALLPLFPLFACTLPPLSALTDFTFNYCQIVKGRVALHAWCLGWGGSETNLTPTTPSSFWALWEVGGRAEVPGIPTYIPQNNTLVTLIILNTDIYPLGIQSQVWGAGWDRSGVDSFLCVLHTYLDSP